jgi:hypothetical protein
MKMICQECERREEKYEICYIMLGKEFKERVCSRCTEQLLAWIMERGKVKSVRRV